MSEINHNTLSQHIKESGKDSFAPVYLIHGEEFIYEQAAKTLVEAILPDFSKHRLQHEIHNAQDTSLSEIIEHLNTYSFFSGKSVIEFRHPSLFVNRIEPGKLIQRIQKAHETSDAAQARQRYLELLGRLRLDPEEITAATLHEKLGIDPVSFGDPAWLLAINEDCVKNRLAAAEFFADTEILQRVIEKGFPKNKHLLIVTDTVDKRTGLYRVIRKAGVIVDCTIPRGTRKADRDEQRRIFLQHAGQITQKHAKAIDTAAFDAMVEMTGFDLRLFTANLEKLIDYAGTRKNITVADIRAVLNPMREDPVYELTGAIADRDTGKALYVLFSLLASGTHELQIIMAITNQIRRLLLIRSFMESGFGRAFQSRVSYDRFQRDILPAARQYDDDLAAKQASFAVQEKKLPEDDPAAAPDEKAAAGKTAGPLPDDVCVFRKKEHPYAAYSMFLKAGNYNTHELISAFSALNRADVALKTSGRSPRAILEDLIIGICGISR
jgi:DNA polymerase III subunit delta